MIVRRWHGRVPNSLAEEYLCLMREVALPDYRGTPGNRGAWCMSRIDGDVTHIEILTMWDDFDAIRRFAGDDVEAAKYYDCDDTFLLEKEPGVVHFELME